MKQKNTKSSSVLKRLTISDRIVIGSILIVSFLLRFLAYHNRWGLGPDQAQFAVTGLYAVRTFHIPLLGPFSSSGPFQTGGEWYWLIMVGQILFPFMLNGAWVFMGALSMLFVALMMITGWQLGGRRLAYVAGILSAVSSAEMTQSTNLSNQTPIAVFALFAIMSGVMYLRTKKTRFMFLAAVSVGIASTIHLQGIALAPVVIMLLLLIKPTLSSVAAAIAGMGLPWIPVEIADSHNHWYNISHMIHYYLVDQYAISLNVLGRNWRTFLATTLPHFWAFTIGNYSLIAIITMCCGGGIIAFYLWKKKWSKDWIFLIGSFLLMTIIVRYAHVPLYESFVVFSHPFILLLTAGVIVTFFNYSAILGIICAIILIAGSMVKNVEEIRHAINLSDQEATRIQNALMKKFPNEKFTLFGRFHSSQSLQLFFYLYYHNLISDTGKPIGVANAAETGYGKVPTLITDLYGTKIVDLRNASPSAQREYHWTIISGKSIYDSTQDWFNQPQTN